MEKVKYRLNDPRLAPRRTRLEIPGWAGKREPRANGSREQVWHCVPFSEGAQYGIELFYPYENELRVSTKGGHLVLGHAGLTGKPGQDHALGAGHAIGAGPAVEPGPHQPGHVVKLYKHFMFHGRKYKPRYNNAQDYKPCTFRNPLPQKGKGRRNIRRPFLSAARD